MYLSKITVHPRPSSRTAFLDVASGGAYRLHQLIWQLFTEDSERQHLFREEQSETGFPIFYTLSRSKPMTEHPTLCVKSKPFEPKLNVGTRLGYSLRVNPTVSKDNKRHDVLMDAKRQCREDGISGQSVLLNMEQAAQQWFSSPERLERWGFSLDFLPEVSAYTRNKTQRKSSVVSYSSVDLQGVLTIQVPEVYAKQLCAGFGRAKAFGCGLMLIRRV